MSKLRKYGLIGYPLEHSFSPGYFANKFTKENIADAQYDLYPLTRIQDFNNLPLDRFSGLNVTIPYKRVIIPYLDELDPIAAEVGAVNTIVFRDGKKIGYNTDVYGFQQSLKNWFESCHSTPRKALILGRGGATRAVRYVLHKMNISFRVISRRNTRWNYQNLTKKNVENYHLIINTTPLGMSPKEDQYPPLPYDAISSIHFLFDLVYNPEKTLFLEEGRKRGARIKNGLEMLYAQAEKAWEIWNQTI